MFERSSISDIIAEYHKKPPVRVISLAHALGLRVYTSASMPEGVSGMIKKDKQKGGDSGFAIFVNANHAETRRRFTIAHEIAHYILHENLIGDGIVEDALLRADNFTSSLERQANALAADILMPWHLIDKAKDKGTKTIEGLSTLFKVSRDAMSYRILGAPYTDTKQKDLLVD